MARPRKDPAYRKHSSGQAVVTLTDGYGGRRDILLGSFDSPESWEKYYSILARWRAAGRTFRTGEDQPKTSVAELLARYMEHAMAYYGVPGGKEYIHMVYALRPVNFLFGDHAAVDFGPKELKTVRALMIEGYDHPEYGPQGALCRRSVNQRVNRIRRAWKWAAGEGLIPASAWHGLQAVDGLRAGRSQARESLPVKPVPAVFVERTLPYLPPAVADMVRLQSLTGMRPGEVCAMRGCDLDTSGEVWFFRPATHKTAYLGHERLIAIGPRGQEIVRKYLRADLEAHLFDPWWEREKRFAERRSRRRTKVQPSQVNRKKEKPRKIPGRCYTTQSYGRAIADGIKKAIAAGVEVPHWHAHQLRHLRATELRKLGGIDLARAVLGHRSPTITETYAEIDLAAAAEAMRRTG